MLNVVINVPTVQIKRITVRHVKAPTELRIHHYAHVKMDILIIKWLIVFYVVINVQPAQIKLIIVRHVKVPTELRIHLHAYVMLDILTITQLIVFNVVMHKALVNISQFTFHFYFLKFKPS